jgi:2-phospho-L-lactate guanylyltransferase
VSTGWSVVLPLKGGPAAKSRLRGPKGLAIAIALDSLDAAMRATQVAQVLVVTADLDLAKQCLDLGACIVDQSSAEGGLAAAIEDGVRAATGPCAVLLGDLPALLPADLDQALEAAGDALWGRPGTGSGPSPQMVFVPDADNSGTVLLAARRPPDLRPRFGPDSAARHQAEGAVALDLPLPRLRRDVDTVDDLIVALALGVGPRTLAICPG